MPTISQLITSTLKVSIRSLIRSANQLWAEFPVPGEATVGFSAAEETDTLFQYVDAVVPRMTIATHV